MNASFADERWRGLVGMYGGYVAAVLADAAAPPEGYWMAGLTIRFTAGVELGPLDLSTSSVHEGRRSVVRRVTLDQDGRRRAEATAVAVRRTDAPAAIRRQDIRAEPPDGYLARPHRQGDLAYSHNLDVRTPALHDPEDGTRAWLRLTAPPAELGLQTPQAAACALLDAMLPVVFVSDDPPAFVPTLEFSYSFTPALAGLGTQWFAGHNRLDWTDGGFCAEDADLHDTTTGRLVARQRQLRSIRRTLPGGHA